MRKAYRVLNKVTASHTSDDASSLFSDDFSTSNIDESTWHTRQLDPADADIYLDALWGPLFFKHERIQRERDPLPRFSDYRMICLFLLLNLTLQLGIAFKIYQLSLGVSDQVQQTLFDGACWRVSSKQSLFGVLYPQSLQGFSGFDCAEPMVTLSMLPEKLDLDQNGFWSVSEAEAVGQTLQKLGSHMASNFSEVMLRMAKYDFKHRIGSKSNTKQLQHLDMDFFKQFRRNIEMCLPIDPNLCGNLEVRGRLVRILPEIHDGQERVDVCRDNFNSFCTKLFGGDYEWIHYKSSQFCGDSTFERQDGVNYVTYGAVSIYEGEPDSILGTTFVSFLVLLLFIWGMLMLEEFRAIYNLMFVLWYITSVSDSDPTFGYIDDGKLFVRRLPKLHKYFAIICIALPRLLIALVILAVGTLFLTVTNNLQDLVLNTTALCFLIEVDNMIHAAFLGEAFQKRVTDNCDVIKVPTSARGAWQSYVFLAFALTTTATWTAWSYFNPRGLSSIGMGIKCLCHFDGDCFGKRLLE